MPGKLGVKLIPRKSTSGKYHSVRELMFALFEKKPTISKDEAEKIIRKEYPKSNFFGNSGRGGHFSWYRHKWNRMKLEDESFNIKEPIQKEKKVEASDERDSNESQKDKAKQTKGMEPKAMGKGGGGRKDRRVPVHKAKRPVVKQARKTVLQHDGSDETNRQPEEGEGIPH